MSLESVYKDSVELSNNVFKEPEGLDKVLYTLHKEGAKSVLEELKFLHKFGWELEVVHEQLRVGRVIRPSLKISKGKAIFYIVKSMSKNNFVRVYPEGREARNLLQGVSSMYNLEKFVEILGRLKNI